MIECWKNLKGIVENGEYYEISNFGNLRSIDRYVKNKNGKRIVKGKELKLANKENGYNSITFKNNGKAKTYYVHRLVAMAFIPNPNNYKQVNHKDECKTNNNVSNLEWCDNYYNQMYGTKQKRCSNSMCKKYKKGYKHPRCQSIIVCKKNTDNTMSYICCFESIVETGEKLKINKDKIRYAMNVNKVLEGYYFKRG